MMNPSEARGECQQCRPGRAAGHEARVQLVAVGTVGDIRHVELR